MELGLLNNFNDKILDRIKYFGLPFGNVDNTDVIVGIFFDVYCPACARMFVECEDYLNSLVSDNQICIYYLHFPIKKGSENIHAILRQIYRKNPQLFIEMLRKFYELVRQGKSDEIKIENVSGLENEVNIVMECKKFGKELGIKGTPSMVIGVKSRNVGILIEGYWGRNAIKKLIERCILKDRDFERLITLLILISNVSTSEEKT